MGGFLLSFLLGKACVEGLSSEGVFDSVASVSTHLRVLDRLTEVVRRLAFVMPFRVVWPLRRHGSGPPLAHLVQAATLRAEGSRSMAAVSGQHQDLLNMVG